MGSELERQSTRLNLIEQKRLDKELKLLSNNQRSMALDIQNSQREMKRRLQKYRERQRELMGETISGPAMTMEDIMRKHQPRLTSDTPSRHHRMSRPRPATAPPPKIDISMFLDIQKSKVDLRPSTAAVRRREMLQQLESQLYPAPHGTYRPITGERLGTAEMEARYFVDEELDERSDFYNDLVLWRKRNERASFKDINGKVMDFCGLEFKDSKPGIKAKWRSVGVVLRFKSLKPPTKEPLPPSTNLQKYRKRMAMVKRIKGAWSKNSQPATSEESTVKITSSDDTSNDFNEPKDESTFLA